MRALYLINLPKPLVVFNHLDDERKALMVDFIREVAEEHQVVVTSYDEDVRLGLEGTHQIEMSRET